MYAIPPVTITDSKLTSSSVPDTVYAAYASGTTYAINDNVSVAQTLGLNKIYRSLQNGNLGNTPATSTTWWIETGDVYDQYSAAVSYALGYKVADNTEHFIYESLAAANLGNPLTNATKWLKLSKTNRWAMFHNLQGTATVSNASIVVTLTPSTRIDSIYFSGSASSITINVTDGVSELYNQTITLRSRSVLSWYEYFFKPFILVSKIIRFDLPITSAAVITVTIENNTGPVECVQLAVGQKLFIGHAQYGAESDVLNFSTVTRDFAGNTADMVQRKNVHKTTQQLLVNKSQIPSILDLRDASPATPIIWAAIPEDDEGYFTALLILGFYKRFSINATYPEDATINLEIEEV